LHRKANPSIECLFCFFVFVLVQKPTMASAVPLCPRNEDAPAALELFYVLVEVMNPTNDGDVLAIAHGRSGLFHAMPIEEVNVVCLFHASQGLTIIGS
jgi:hypothetical protein